MTTEQPPLPPPGGRDWKRTVRSDRTEALAGTGTAVREVPVVIVQVVAVPVKGRL